MIRASERDTQPGWLGAMGLRRKRILGSPRLAPLRQKRAKRQCNEKPLNRFEPPHHSWQPSCGRRGSPKRKKTQLRELRLFVPRLSYSPKRAATRKPADARVPLQGSQVLTGSSVKTSPTLFQCCRHHSDRVFCLLGRHRSSTKLPFSAYPGFLREQALSGLLRPLLDPFT